ncbi:hypothetical protein BT67DRAFT_450505 [Trichocladium antarcticum]|uniref:DUF4440 domain-containing protein n=1 Tax=Trichocladium antarcticum TaxID=1450529 RepID=A0AAN6ZCG8_9PEZI|nr:hypothetical protein BT67DRAFT_450505 [Trichocladium antarcticum]
MPTALGLTNEPSAQTQKQKQKPPGSGPHVSPSTTMGSNERLDTISKRNHAAAREMETLLWRALVDDPDTAREYLAHDAVMINPLLCPRASSQPLSGDTDPKVQDVLERGQRYTGFRFHGEPLVVEVGLMAVALVYRMSLYKLSRKSKGGQKEIGATASSTWRQTAGADWLLCAQHVQFCDDEEDDDYE